MRIRKRRKNKPVVFRRIDPAKFISDYALTNGFSRPPSFKELESEPETYYHSTGSMNPIALKGILTYGICSKNKAESLGISTDSNGLGCNGANYISVATKLGGCMQKGRGAFHFAIDRNKVKGSIRKNPEQNMPLERQIQTVVPISAIIGIYLEEESFFDIEHPSIKLGIGHYLERAKKQILSYENLMNNEFSHSLPEDDIRSIQSIILKMRDCDLKEFEDFLEYERTLEKHEQTIELILKKNLKHCFQKVFNKKIITPYDIIRHYNENITVYDHHGNEICNQAQDVTPSSPNLAAKKLKML